MLVIFLTLEESIHSLTMKNEICSTSNSHTLCIGLFLHVYMGVHVCGCMYTTLCTYEGLRLSGIAISCSSHVIRLGKGTQSNTKLTNTVSGQFA